MKQLRKNERGIILVAVLLAVSILFIVASIVSAQSMLTSRQSLNSQFKLTQLYDNESLQTEILYKAYIDQQYRNLTQSFPEDEEFDPFIPGGQQRFQENEESKIYFKIKDALTGYPLWDSSKRLLRGQLQDQLALESENQAEAFALHFEKIKEYQGQGTMPLGNGDGELYNSPLLPRNGSIQFIEELLWVPQELSEGNLYSSLGLNLAYPAQLDEVIQVPTLLGRSKKLRASQNLPSFFSSSNTSIAATLQLTDEELQVVQEAKQAWFGERIHPSQSLGALYTRIKARYSFTISSFYTIVQEARNRDNLSAIVLKTTVNIGSLLPRNTETAYIRFIRRLLY